MSAFKYKLLTSSSGVIEGEKEAIGKLELINDLRKSGHVILNIQQVDKNKKFGLFLNRVNKKAVLSFTQELATLLEGGIPIDKSLSILLSVQDNNTIKNVVEDLLNRIKSGKSFAEALTNHTKLFTSVYINMVRAGEEGGVLSQVLKRLGAFQERLQKVRGEIISAMIYPLLLSSTGLMSVGALIVYVIPKFAQIFEGMGISLPFSTMILMGLSRYSIRYGWVSIILAMIKFFFFQKGFLPEIAVHLLKVGEETGNLDQMLLKVADNFDADVEQRMKRLVTMVEPVLILLMGAVIGVIVISMLTAILSVNDLRF